MQGSTLTLSLLFCVLLPFGKRVRESVFPCMGSSGSYVSIQGNKLSLTFFQKEGKKKEKGGLVCCLACYQPNVPILSVVSCCSWSRWKTLIPSERPTVGIKLIREIKIMNYCKGVKNIQFPLQPKTILITSMVPPIRLKNCLHVSIGT